MIECNRQQLASLKPKKEMKELIKLLKAHGSRMSRRVGIGRESQC